MLDVEQMGRCRSGRQTGNLIAEVATFLAMVEEHYGRRPIVYTDALFDALYLRGHFARETFWARSIVLPPWFRTDQWLIWQYQSCGRRAGIGGPVDLNAFRGSRREFDVFASGA